MEICCWLVRRDLPRSSYVLDSPHLEGNRRLLVNTIWNWGRIKSTIPPSRPSAPSSRKTMIRLLESMSCPRLGQSERFIVREGGTKAKGVMPTEKKCQNQEI